MAKKKAYQNRPTKKSPQEQRAKRGAPAKSVKAKRFSLRLPDAKALASVDPTSAENVQPAWIGEQHPEYVEDQMQHGLSSVRTFAHAGHQVRIQTTYQIEVDGAEVHLHAIVDNEGRLRCHTTPYESYPSATDLLRTLIDRFPQSFSDLGSRHSHD